MYIRIEKDGSLYQLLHKFLDAYNRRTNVMEASTDLSIQRQIDALTGKVDNQADNLQQAVDNAKET